VADAAGGHLHKDVFAEEGAELQLLNPHRNVEFAKDGGLDFHEK
jgi:hypothetical protein